MDAVLLGRPSADCSRDQCSWACDGSVPTVPGPSLSICGLEIAITEDFVAGLGGGNGTLEYRGRTYPFKVLGTVAGPGGGVEKISVSGPVYKLANVSDFAGRYTQSTGKAGFSSSGSSDLWLENNSGVSMHLQGTSSGAMLTLGKDEIFVRMNQ
jgi:hypothetical protein